MDLVVGQKWFILWHHRNNHTQTMLNFQQASIHIYETFFRRFIGAGSSNVHYVVLKINQCCGKYFISKSVATVCWKNCLLFPLFSVSVINHCYSHSGSLEENYSGNLELKTCTLINIAKEKLFRMFDKLQWNNDTKIQPCNLALSCFISSKLIIIKKGICMICTVKQNTTGRWRDLSLPITKRLSVLEGIPLHAFDGCDKTA